MASVGTCIKGITRPGALAYACLIEEIIVNNDCYSETLIGRYFYNLPGQAKSTITKLKKAKQTGNRRTNIKVNVFELIAAGTSIVWKLIETF